MNILKNVYWVFKFNNEITANPSSQTLPSECLYVTFSLLYKCFWMPETQGF